MLSTGILSLDRITGGLPYKIVEISGPANTSKSSFIFNLIKANSDYISLYIDIDHSMNYNYMKKTFGLDEDNVIITQPTDTEQMINIIETLVDDVDIIIIDSLPSLISKEELQKSMTQQMNYNYITETIKKLAAVIRNKDTALILVNQVRSDLKAKRYNAETTVANKALNLYASIRLEIKQTNEIHKYDQIIGSKLLITVVKNKLRLTNPSNKSVSISHYFNSGYDTTDDLLDLACEYSIIDKRGSYYYYRDNKLGQGKDTVKQYIENTDGLLEELYGMIKSLI
jgi:recombination protein RecA